MGAGTTVRARLISLAPTPVLVMWFERFTATYPTETPQSPAEAAGAVVLGPGRETATAGVPLEEYAPEHERLRAAVDAFGDRGR